MTFLILAVARAIVSGALENKYDRTGDVEFDCAVAEAWNATEGAPSEDGLRQFLRPTNSFSTDIMNHVVVLRLIEEFWRRQPVMRNPICHIRQAIYGVPDRPPDMRASQYVGDYGGVVPTELADMRGALAELELVVERFVPMLRGQTADSQAVFLAHVFSSIIRIHPFGDGNGRAARMTTEYCLRCWDRPYLPLPKVRNAPNWRDALDRAVTGDPAALVQEFISRMTASGGDSGGKITA